MKADCYPNTFDIKTPSIQHPSIISKQEDLYPNTREITISQTNVKVNDV